jgi:hypothetical protein
MVTASYVKSDFELQQYWEVIQIPLRLSLLTQVSEIDHARNVLANQFVCTTDSNHLFFTTKTRASTSRKCLLHLIDAAKLPVGSSHLARKLTLYKFFCTMLTRSGDWSLAQRFGQPDEIAVGVLHQKLELASVALRHGVPLRLAGHEQRPGCFF